MKFGPLNLQYNCDHEYECLTGSTRAEIAIHPLFGIGVFWFGVDLWIVDSEGNVMEWSCYV